MTISRTSPVMRPDGRRWPWREFEPHVCKALWDAGIRTTADLAATTINRLAELDGITRYRAKLIRKVVPRQAKREDMEVTLRPTESGGALQTGNPLSAGRMRLRAREACRAAFHGRVSVLEEIADGEPVVKGTVMLYEVLQHAECPKCGSGLKLRKDATAKVKLEGLLSASVPDRVRALDVLAKYGLGPPEKAEGLGPEDLGALVEALAAATEPFVNEEDEQRLEEAWFSVLRDRLAALRLG